MIYITLLLVFFFCNGKAILFVDEASSASQTEAILKIITGQEGGMPWEALAGTLTEFEGPVLKPIELTVDGNKSSFRISGALEVNMTPLMNSVSGEEQDVPNGPAVCGRGDEPVLGGNNRRLCVN